MCPFLQIVADGSVSSGLATSPDQSRERPAWGGRIEILSGMGSA